MERIPGLACATLLAGAMACGDAAGGEGREYAATLAEERHHLILFAGDAEGLLRVGLTAHGIRGDACPTFQLTGNVNGQALRTAEPGGLIRIAHKFAAVEYECSLPVYELEYDPSTPRPEELRLELGDDSFVLRATVRAAQGTPAVRLLDAQASAGALVSCEVSPDPYPSGLSAVIEDAAGATNAVDVVEKSGQVVSLRMPTVLPPGRATLVLRSPHWIPNETESCEGPEQCQLSLRESLAGYETRSTVRVGIDVL